MSQSSPDDQKRLSVRHESRISTGGGCSGGRDCQDTLTTPGGLERERNQTLGRFTARSSKTCPDHRRILVPPVPKPLTSFNNRDELRSPISAQKDAVFPCIVAGSSSSRNLSVLLARERPRSVHWTVRFFAPHFYLGAVCKSGRMVIVPGNESERRRLGQPRLT